MNSIELLYINFINHVFLSGLEINFSQEVGFKLNENKELNIFRVDSTNIFDGSIANLNVIVGKNGMGKTTVINTIYDVLHGSVGRDVLIAIKKNDEIIVCTEDSNIVFDADKAGKSIGEYSFKTQNSGFILDVVPYSDRDESHIQEAISIVYISEFTDPNVSSSSHRFEDKHAFNYSPFALINSPNSFLKYDDFINHSLNKTVANFQLISKIHQIKFLERHSNFFDFLTPNSVEITFNTLLHRLDDYSRTDVVKNKKFDLEKLVVNILKTRSENAWKSILDAHLVFSLVNILDISNYAIDKGKATELRQLEYATQQEFDTDRLKVVDIYKVNIVESLSHFTQKKILISDLNKELVDVIKSTAILNFYSNSHNDEEPNIIKEIQDVIVAYIKLINAKENDLGNHDSNIKLNLNDSSEFLKDYVILRGHADFFNEITLCMPESIKYFNDANEFYFSSGQESLLRIFNYIDLATFNLKQLLNREEIQLILLIDEPDTALHPEMQKQFIRKLNDFLNCKVFEQCKFHVIMTTHSPVIISDLTSNHVIFLENEGTEDNKMIRSLTGINKPKTFAQNIYNLYKESFFINNGLIGSFAENKINNVISQIKPKKNGKYPNIKTKKEEELRKIIDLIGEPILKNKLNDMLDMCVYNGMDKTNTKKRLENKIERLKKQLISLDGEQ